MYSGAMSIQGYQCDRCTNTLADTDLFAGVGGERTPRFPFRPMPSLDDAESYSQTDLCRECYKAFCNWVKSYKEVVVAKGAN